MMRRKEWLLGLLLVVATFVAYQPMWHSGFIWDDDEYLTSNPTFKNLDFKSPGCLHQIWLTTSALDYYPMTYTFWWLEMRFWDDNPLGYHLVNVLLHALSAVVLWRVLLRLKIPGAILAAGLFALHPVNVESVAWISEGKNVFCMFFYMLTVLAWLKFEDSGRWGWHGLAMVLFALALLSKTAVSPLPLVLLVLAWWRRGRIEWKDVGRVAPFFIMAAVLSLVTVWFHSHRAIASDVVRTDNLWSRVAGAGWAVWFYFYKAVLPLNLAFVYPRWHINTQHALSYLPLGLLAAALLFSWRCQRGLFFALAYFVLMLLPVLGFLNIYFMRYSLVADHWQYFAIIGPLALFAAVIRKPVAVIAIMVVLGGLTWKQCGMYADAETLWQTTLRQNPDSWMARSNLGTLLSREGRMDEAISQFEKALEIKPDDAEARRNLGLAFVREGKMDQAIPQYQKALEIQPDYAAAHNDLGNIFSQMGRTDEAMAQYQEALKTEPDDADAHLNLGNILFRLHRMDEALLQYQKALEIRPNFAEAHNSLGACYYRQGKMDEAIAQYQAAVQLKPQSADTRLNLANALLNVGRASEAVAQFQQVVQILPDDPKALSSLAWVLATCAQSSLRDGAKAITLAKHANERTGGQNPIVLNTLGAAYAETGQFRQAMDMVQQALEIAQIQSNNGLISQLQFELQLYQSGKPFHVPAEKH